MGRRLSLGLLIACIAVSLLLGEGLLLLCIARDTKTQDRLFVSNGTCLGSISMPPESSTTVRNAGQELATYVRKMTGAEVPINIGLVDSQQPTILLSEYEHLPRDFRSSIPEPPVGGYVQITQGNTLCLVAQTPRTVQFAVYGLLEDIWGVHWFWPSGSYEYVPRQSTLSLPDGKRMCRPSFPHRWTISPHLLEKDNEAKSWMLHNRADPDSLPGYKRLHTYKELVPNTYFNTNPEYFALIDGKRWPYTARPRRGQLCTTNRGAIQTAIQTVKEYFDNHPGAIVYTVGPNDSPRLCEDAACCSLDDGRTMYFRGKRRPVTSDRVLTFANEIALAIQKTHPGRKIISLAYHTYTPAPQRVRPLDNVIIWLCHHTPASYSRTMDDPRSKANREFMSNLNGWLKHTNQLIVSTYIYKPMADQVFWPVEKIYAQDLKMLRDRGVVGIFGQGKGDNFGLLGMQYWVITRLMWDVDLDVDRLVDTYCKLFYGPAYFPMKKFHLTLRQAMMGGEVDLNKRVYRIYSEILTPQIVELLNNNLRQAEALVQKDSVYGKRLGKIHFALDYNMLLLNVSKAYFAYRKNAYSKQALSNLIICLSKVKSFGEHNKKNKGTIRFNGTGWPKGGSLTERLYKSYLEKVKQIENDSD